MTTIEEKAQVLKLVDTLADDLREVVQSIEGNKCPSTVCKYETYLAIISEGSAVLGNSSAKMKLVIALALQQAGANTLGVVHALRLAL